MGICTRRQSNTLAPPNAPNPAHRLINPDRATHYLQRSRGRSQQETASDACHTTEIKSLDGSRKALVYDNYSKLIAATDTIRRMRTNMDPLTPATTTLAPAVSHIAETAAALSGALLVGGGGGGREAGAEAEQRAGRERATVRWVLDAPRRLGRMAAAGQKEAAAAEWEELEGLLGRWEGVAGVEELRRRCEAALLGEEGVR